MGKSLLCEPKILAQRLLNKYKDRLFILCSSEGSERGDLLLYDESTGTFSSGELRLKRHIADLLGKRSRIHEIEEAASFVRLLAPRKAREEFDNRSGIVVLNNGAYDLESGKLRPHSSELLCRVQMPHNFDPKARCPRFDQFLVQILNPDYHALVEELLGAALFGDVSHQQIPLFHGPGANGKSVLAKASIGLVGPENVSCASLHELADNRFSRAELEGKRMNVCTDIDSNSPKSLRVLKALVSGDPILAERKYRPPFLFVNSALLLFSCNQLPSFKEAGRAITRRFIIIPFYKSFSEAEADLDLPAKLTTREEMSGVLNRAIAGYRRLREQGFYSVPEEAKRIWRNHVGELDPMEEFLRECTSEQSTARTSKDELYRLYRIYCEGDFTEDRGAGVRPVSRHQFNAAVRRHYPRATESKMGAEDRRKCWVGVALKPDHRIA